MLSFWTNQNDFFTCSDCASKLVPTLQPNEEIVKSSECNMKTTDNKVMHNFLYHTYLVAESGQAYKRNQHTNKSVTYSLCK